MGSEHDISGFVGFTHLIEHLLFTGSTNFPEQHHIEKIVNKHQGEQNGVTKAFTTSFYFKIDKSGLDDFLPALVDAIQNPTFSEENILKEINNVNSEISMRMTFNKNLAYYKLMKKVGNPDSKLFQDGFANIDASKIDVKALREQLLEFHRRFYSANIMTLAVISDDEFRSTRKMIESRFSGVPNKMVERSFFNSTSSYLVPFGPEVFKQVFYIEGFTEPSKMTIVFQTTSDLSDSRFHPLDFFSYFLNYFSENSLKQVLIKKNLITSFSDTIALQDYVNALYIVSFTLTAHGLNHATEILREFYRFIDFVKNIPDKNEIFADLSKASKYSFLFGVKSEFMDFSQIEQGYFDRAVDFSETIQDYSPDMIFTAKNVMFQFNSTEFSQVINSLNSENAFYIIESSKYKKQNNETSTIKISDIEKPVKNRKLKQVQTFFATGKFETAQQSLDSFFGLKEQGMFTRHQLHDRLLEETIIMTDALVEPELVLSKPTPLESFFNRPYETVLLDKSFDFDNGRMYNQVRVPDEHFVAIKNYEKLTDNSYDTCKSFDTTYLNKYNMITKCQAPNSLRTMVVTSPETTEDVLKFVNNYIRNPEDSNGIRTEKLFSAIFSSEENQMDINERYTTLRDLLIYKLCIIQDFDGDDKHENAKTVSESTELNVYHQLFRKTLQPKSVIIMTLESQSVLSSIMSNDFDQRVEKALLMEVLCMYMMRHVEFLYRGEYIKGNDFSCKVVNYRVVFEFEGFTEQLESFIVKTVTSFQSLTMQSSYQSYIIKNFQQRIIDIYSQFTAISSLKSSTFYLNLIMDKIFIDNSSPEKVALIKLLVLKITSENLSAMMSELLIGNKLYVLGVGNLNESYVEKVAAKTRTAVSLPYQVADNPIDFLEFRRFMFGNFVSKIHRDEHVLVRLENIDKAESNSVYLTYFKIKRMTRSVKIHALILNHFLKKLVYDHLRNNLNLGYVTQSGLKVYYHVS